MQIKKQTNIETIICAIFEKTKLHIFIFVVFKKAIDCMIIDNPLNDKIPEQIEIERGEIVDESSLHPRVTSIKP